MDPMVAGNEDDNLAARAVSIKCAEVSFFKKSRRPSELRGKR